MSDTSIKEYPTISPYGYIKDDKVFLKGYYDFKDREIGVVRESEEESMRYFVNRYEMAKAKVESVKKSVEESDNKGSYLMKLIHMRTYLAQYNGLGDFPALFEEINNLEDSINEYIEKNRVKNTEIKHSLLDEAELLKDSQEWDEATERFQELKMNWIKTGSAHKDEEDLLSERFHAAMDTFFKKRKDFFEHQKEVMRRRARKYRNLIAYVRDINYKGGGADYSDQVKQYQQDWKDVGNIPKGKYVKLYQQFRKETNVFFTALKEGKPVTVHQPVRMKSSIEIKADLLKETEQLLNDGVPFNISIVKKKQTAWKNLGKLPQAEDKNFNLKFRILCNEIFETHFLEKTCRDAYPDMYSRTPAEQIRIRMQVLQEGMDQDQAELDEFNYRHGAALAMMNPKTGAPADMKLYQERNNFVNKLKTKRRILDKLQVQLNSI